MNITYDTKACSWRLLYRDPAKLTTHRWPYTRTSIRDAVYPTLTRTERRLRRLQIQRRAAALETGETTARADLPIRAADFFKQAEEKPCRSAHAGTQLNSRVAVRRFRAWVQQHHPQLCMHELTMEKAEAFFRTLRHLSVGTLNKYRLALSYLCRRLIQEQRDKGSSRLYNNPFAALDMAEIKCEPRVLVKRCFTLPQIRALVQPCAACPQQAAVWHLLYLTGWRLYDVLNLQWSQIDPDARTLRTLHRKTARHGIATVLWLSDSLAALFRTLRTPDAHPTHVFPQWADSLQGREGCNFYEQRFIRAAHRRLDALGMGGGERYHTRFCRYYSAHCMRATVITLLKEHDFNTERIMYLCGHRGGSLEARAYNRFYERPYEATADMLRYLEGLVKE